MFPRSTFYIVLAIIVSGFTRFANNLSRAVPAPKFLEVNSAAMYLSFSLHV